MAYTPNAQDPTTPTIDQLAGNMAYELQSIKGYIQSLVATGTNFAYIGGFRNRLKNGAANVAQRGTVIVVTAGSTVYTLDQWLVSATGGNATVSQQTAGGPTIHSSYMQITGAAGNSNLAIYNRIESLDSTDFIAGAVVTVSGYYNVGVSLAPGVPNISLVSATVVDNWAAATPVGVSAPLNIYPQIVSTWQYFSTTFTLTADATTGLGVAFIFPAGIPVYTVSFANIQLEMGAQHTMFEQRPLGLEFMLCQRYYQVYTYIYNLYQVAGGNIATNYPLPTPMRSSPVVTNTNNTTINITGAGITSTFLQYSIVGTATALGVIIYTGLITLSAELI